jgi:hypothetical protein
MALLAYNEYEVNILLRGAEIICNATHLTNTGPLSYYSSPSLQKGETSNEHAYGHRSADKCCHHRNSRVLIVTDAKRLLHLFLSFVFVQQSKPKTTFVFKHGIFISMTLNNAFSIIQQRDTQSELICGLLYLCSIKIRVNFI